jgi:hypothetical protein
LKPNLVFLTSLEGTALAEAQQYLDPDVAIVLVRDLATLQAAPFDSETTLLSFGTGCIVPVELLARLKRPAYNIHAASPQFPGRDPHHHAIYAGATEYGATLHIMTARVDAGPIIATETFSVRSGTTPGELLKAANEAGLRLLRRYGRSLSGPQPIERATDLSWGPCKTSRRDLLRRCQLPLLIDEPEFLRRKAAFSSETHDNLTVVVHGHVFRIDRTREPVPTDPSAFAEFTEAGYRKLLEALKGQGYTFARYGETAPGRHVLWRHDVDFSMHRALRLARIEAEEGIFSTWFVNPRCTFYNLAEPAISKLAAGILALGHEIGLHFDAEAFPHQRWTRVGLEQAVSSERALVESITGAPVRCVSWHNPDLTNLLDFKDDLIAGLINTYGETLRRDYVYGSDSNGYWRFKPMRELIAEGHERLHLLTHPAWWTPEPMSPSARIDRAIEGRARAVRAAYEATLEKGGRRNLTD